MSGADVLLAVAGLALSIGGGLAAGLGVVQSFVPFIVGKYRDAAGWYLLTLVGVAGIGAGFGLFQRLGWVGV